MAHTHVKYPQSLPMDCVIGAIDILRQGPTKIAAQSPLVVKHLWTVGSYGLFLKFGEPGDEPLMGAASPDDQENAAEQLAELETLLLEHEQQVVNYGSSTAEATADASIDPATIAMLIQLVLSVIKNLRRR